jgi:hypothetical protein
MADNLKPYDPNKGFISFRLNPDALKEALIEQVPYNRTLRHIYNNPDGDIRETAKVAASETPILGSLLSGEPTDAIKEAFLLGTPSGFIGRGKSPKVKKDVAKNPNRDYFNYRGELYYKDKDKYVNAYDKTDKLKVKDYHKDIEGKNTGAYKYNDYKEVLNDIDASEKVAKEIESNPNKLGLKDRSVDLHNSERDIAKVDDFMSSHKVPKNKEVYSNLAEGVLVWDPKKQVGTVYHDWSGNFGPGGSVWDNGKPFSNKNNALQDWNKVDQTYRANTALERKLLEQDAELFNINYEPQSYGEFLPMTADNARTYSNKNNNLFRSDY